MKNLKIRDKLYGLSSLLLFSLFVTNLMSLLLMAEVNKGTSEVSANWLPSVILAEELNTATSDFRIAEASHVISQDEVTMLQHEETLFLIGTTIQNLFAEYQEFYVTNEVDAAIISDAEALWGEYVQINRRMITYSRENDTSSAMYLMEHESEEIFLEVSDLFLTLVQFNKAGADRANTDGDAIYFNTVRFVAVSMLVSVFVGFFCSRTIIRSILRPVSEIEIAASEILKGKLSTEIQYHSNDELGNLSNSMRNLCHMIQEMIVDLSYLLGGMAEGNYQVKSGKTDLYVGDFHHILQSTDNISDKLSEAIFQLHHRDNLTGFYNRTGFTARIDQVLHPMPQSMGILSVNINGLKCINESNGISSGDMHIKSCATLLAEQFGHEFFRMSGDEILGIAPNISKEDLEEQVNLLHQFMHKEENYSFSLGHSWCEGNFHLWRLIQEAETVMYINKQEYYSSTQRESSGVDDVALAELLHCLEDEEFMVYLQPQVHLSDGSLYGAEALIRRFDKKEQKMVFPDQFIPLYEQRSIIRHVDLFVVEQVCRLQAQWQRNLPISVNLSRVTLLEYGIVDTIAAICDKYQVPHGIVVIEVTERVGLIENNVASSLISDFKSQGFHISLDDFGCAYSNIITLAQIEVDEVKIDKSLVDHVTDSKKNLILVKNVLAMCNELGDTSTLAEGIEIEEQAHLLRDLGCHLGQGYFYDRPLPVEDFCRKYELT